MSINSEVLGKISVEQRFVNDDTASWQISIGTVPTNEQCTSLRNFATAIGGVVSITGNKQNFTIEVVKTMPEAESEIVLEVINRFVKVIDGRARQLKETPLAEHSTVSMHGHYHQD